MQMASAAPPALAQGQQDHRPRHRRHRDIVHEAGAEWARLEQLGLEYRFVSEFLQGKIATKDELFEKLNLAIGQFAKRQETWFRGMEKKGVKIHWLPESMDVDERFEAGLRAAALGERGVGESNA